MLAGLALAGCTSSGHPAKPASSPATKNPPTTRAGSTAAVPSHTIAGSVHDDQAVDGGVPLRAAPCAVALPGSWRHAIDAGQLWAHNPADTTITGVPAPASDALLLEHDASPTATTAQMRLVGADGRTVTELGTVARPHGVGGYGANAADGRRIAFVYQTGDGEGLQNQWQLYVWDRVTRRLQAVAHNPVAHGKPLPGGFVEPVLSGDYLYWIEASVDTRGYTPSGVGSRLRQYDFTTGRTRTLYDGLVTSVVPYGKDVLFTAVPAGRPEPLPKNGNRAETVRAMDQATGTEVAAPGGLTAGADRPDRMVTDGDLVAWDTTDGGVNGWRPEWGATRPLLPAHRTAGLAEISYAGDLAIAGHYLVMHTPKVYVLDLATDSLATLTDHVGAQAVTGGRVGIWQYTSDAKPGASGRAAYSAYLVDLSALPDLPRC